MDLQESLEDGRGSGGVRAVERVVDRVVRERVHVFVRAHRHVCHGLELEGGGAVGAIEARQHLYRVE